MRTIKITGKGQIKVKPDVTRITITLEDQFNEYEETLCRSSEDTEKLRELVQTLGFEKTDLKTLRFNVDPAYESYQENNEYKSRFVGYEYCHNMKLEFESDNDRLGKILYALAHCPLNPQFRLSYTIKDPEATKNKLLGKAVSDAKEKAVVLANASGVQLKDIQNVDYSWGRIDVEIEPIRLASSKVCKCSELVDNYSLGIEPEEIDLSDTVTIIWEIE